MLALTTSNYTRLTTERQLNDGWSERDGKLMKVHYVETWSRMRGGEVEDNESFRVHLSAFSVSRESWHKRHKQLIWSRQATLRITLRENVILKKKQKKQRQISKRRKQRRGVERRETEKESFLVSVRELYAVTTRVKIPFLGESAMAHEGQCWREAKHSRGQCNTSLCSVFCQHVILNIYVCVVSPGTDGESVSCIYTKWTRGFVRARRKVIGTVPTRGHGQVVIKSPYLPVFTKGPGRRFSRPDHLSKRSASFSFS